MSDVFSPGPGNDQVHGSPGDTLDYRDAQHSIVIDLRAGSADGEGHDRVVGVYRIIGALHFPNVLLGSAAQDALTGGDRSDIIRGRGGNDLLAGGDGDDRILGGPGSDRLNGHGGDDLLSGEEGDDVLRGNWGADTLVGGSGSNDNDGGLGIDYCTGDPTPQNCEEP
jgi:Ca2+-binding RTX toxin-like protein